MEIGKTLYVKDRKAWRSWLSKNHSTEPEIWLIYNRKRSGKASIAYGDAVEEALCFGWIDSIEKGLDDERFVQRFTPRRKGSNWSEPNKERVRRLFSEGKMTKVGLAVAAEAFQKTELKIAPDILKALTADPAVWENFTQFSGVYKTVRIGWIEGARKRPQEFQKRLRYFVKMTRQDKKFGMVQ